MKSIKSGLLSGWFIAALMMMCVSGLRAQQTGQLVSEERLIPVQGGTMQLNNGNLTIALNENTMKQLSGADATYMVTLTPIGDCGPLKVQQKGTNQFVVREDSKQGSNNTFDYVVLVKKKMFTGVKLENAAK